MNSNWVDGYFLVSATRKDTESHTYECATTHGTRFEQGDDTRCVFSKKRQFFDHCRHSDDALQSKPCAQQVTGPHHAVTARPLHSAQVVFGRIFDMKIPNSEFNVGDVPLRPARTWELVLAPTLLAWLVHFLNVRGLILFFQSYVCGRNGRSASL